MSGHASQAEAFRTQAASAFGFLVDEAGFNSPELITHGGRFRGLGFDVEVIFLDGHEPQVVTWIVRVAPGGERSSGSLDCLYVAGGCGPSQDVPGAAPTRRAMLKRVDQHAAALRKLLPQLLSPEVEQLLRRCRARSQPTP